MNNVTLIGRLVRNPEVSYTHSQTALCKFTLAVDRISKEERTADFIRIVVWGKQAENCGRYLYKGKQCAVNGRIQTGSYKDKDGKTVYTTDVIAYNVEFLGDKTGDRPADEQPTEDTFLQELAEDDLGAFSYADDGMPF